MSYTQRDKTDLVIDIETLAMPVTQAALDTAMEEYEPPANYKTDEAIAKHKAKFKLGLVDKLSKENMFSIGGKRMISAALARVDHEEGEVVDVQSWISDDLAIVTGGVIEYLNQYRDYRLVGFNHIGFDLPELAKSFYLTGVRPKYKPTKWDLIDLMNHPFRKGGLKATAQAFGIEISDVNGAAVAEMYEQGRLEEIAKYNELDVIITGKLYLAAGSIYSFF